MNSKERVKNVLCGLRSDRMPIGFASIDSDVASKVLGRPTYWRNKAQCKIAFWEGRRAEVVQSWIEDGIELYRKLDLIDIMPVWGIASGICPPKTYEFCSPQKIDENTWVDRFGSVYRYSPITNDIEIIKKAESSFSCIYFPIAASDETIFEVADAMIAEFPEKFILGPSGDECAWLMSSTFEDSLINIAQDPVRIKSEYLRKVQEANILDAKFVRKGQDGVIWGEDLAGQNGCFISPQSYYELFFNGYRSRVKSVQNLGLKVIKHCCGNCWTLLDMFKQVNIDCYQSIQQSAGMDLNNVYDIYNASFTLWAGVNVETLMMGSNDEVRKEVRNIMQNQKFALKFIMGTSHSVPNGTKYDNFMTMLDEYSKCVSLN